MRRRHGSSVVVRLDGHDRVGPDLTQLPLLLPPLSLPETSAVQFIHRNGSFLTRQLCTVTL